MTKPFDEPRYLNALVRWRMLAQRRHADLTQEYESGRWKRYFSEPEILRLLHQAKMSVDVWIKIAPLPENAPAVAEIDVRTLPPLVTSSPPIAPTSIAA